MVRYYNEIKEFFTRKPRFNVVLIKGKQTVGLEELGKKLRFQVVDLKKLAIEGEIEIERIDGYTNLLESLKEISKKIGGEGILFLNLDLYLSVLSRKKREQFFERILQRTFPEPAIFMTVIFKDEVPEVRHQEFNYAKVIEGEG